MQQTVTSFLQNLQRSYLTRHELFLAYYTVLIPRLTYTFATTTYAPDFLFKIQKKIAQALIPRLGYSSKTPRVIIYGSPKCGGIGLRNLYIEQDIAKINILF